MSKLKDRLRDPALYVTTRDHATYSFLLLFFHFSPDNCGSFHTHKDERGSMNIELQWSKATPYPISLIVYGVFHDELQIDLDRIAYTTSSVQG